MHVCLFARWWAARALLDMGHPSQALARLGTAPEGEDSAKAWQALQASIDLQMGRRADARARITQGLEPLVALQAWIGVLRDAGQLAQARAAVADARQSGAKDMALDLIAANLALEAAQPDEALALTEPWIEGDAADSFALRYAHAQAVSQIQGASAAVGMMRMLHQEQPTHVGAMLHLARWSVESDRPGATRLAEGVVDREPANPDALSLLGWLYHESGRHSAAVRMLERAVRAAPRDTDIADRLRRVQNRVVAP